MNTDYNLMPDWRNIYAGRAALLTDLGIEFNGNGVYYDGASSFLVYEEPARHMKAHAGETEDPTPIAPVPRISVLCYDNRDVRATLAVVLCLPTNSTPQILNEHPMVTTARRLFTHILDVAMRREVPPKGSDGLGLAACVDCSNLRAELDRFLDKQYSQRK